MQKYLFVLEHGTVEYIPYFSYLDIKQMWLNRGKGRSEDAVYSHRAFAGVGFDRGDTYKNYQLMIFSMLNEWRGGKLGTGDTELDNKLANDLAMYLIYELYIKVRQQQSSFTKFLRHSSLVKEYKLARKFVDAYGRGDGAKLTKEDVQRMELIFQTIEMKLALSKK